MVDVTPGNEGANKGFWRVQLRDRFGQFVKMGGMVMFDIQLPGVDGIVQAFGKFIGNSEIGVARLEVLDNSRIPKGVYLVKHSDITAIKAVLPDAYVEEKTEESIAERAGETPPAPLKSKISGSEALALRLKSMGNLLREDGRFPAPRMSFLDRKDSDNRRAAQRDYRKVFDAEPALQEKYKTFENMWEQVYKYGTDERTQSPNALADIPEDMKELNRAYAKHFLGLDPEGLITVYRNAVNGKDTPEESAVGYASTDALMAYDYASHRDNVAANGRYEIDVKPGEIFGMLGYSRIEDEYGVTIGRELANIPGRVRRVGDLAMVLPDAPWLKEWGLGFNRGKGASPFRQYTLATSHDFHPVEPFGESLEEFFTKYNLSAADIKKKFDQIYGEGAYDRYKATGNSVSFQRIRDLFVKLENGQIGLDVKKLENLSPLREVSEYTGDLFDNTLKMLSVFQELTGQYFMTHKTRDYSPDKQEVSAPTTSEPDPTTQGAVSYPDLDHFDVPPLEPKTVDEILALSYYTGETKKYVDGHKAVNTYLRTGKHYDGVNSPEAQAYVLKQIDALQRLVNSQTIDKNIKTFRYQEEVPEDLKAGDVWSSSGFLSTSTSTTMQGDQTVETEFASLPVQIEVNIPAGFRGGAVDTSLGRDEGEVLLPPGSKFVVQSIEAVDEKTKISLLLVEQDDQVEAESSAASDDMAKRIAMELEEDPSVRFFKKVGPQLGSNEGGTFRDSIVTGKEFYVKTPKSEEHRRNEMLASALYRLTNIGSAGVRFGSDANGVEKTYSEIIPGRALAETELTAKTKKEIQEGFAIDAWLANWDVAGLEDDNIIIDGIGRPYRIDMGGALLFRAQGALKGEAFGDEVAEIDTLRDPDKNPASAALFGDMTYSDLVASASKLLDVSPKEIDILVDATFDEPLAAQLKNKLKARRNSILSRFNLLDGSELADSLFVSEKPTDYSSIDYGTSEFTEIVELETSTEEELAALSYYTGEDVAVYGVGYDKINEYLRKKQWGSDVQNPEEQQKILKTIEILKKIVNSTTINKDIKVIRYQNSTLLGAMAVGDIWTSDGFLSTATMTDGGEEVYNAFTGAPVEIEINIPKGSRGGAVPESVEAEVLLPPGSRFVVQSVEKINFRDTKIKLLLVGQDG
jgi:hypothetical protein